MTKIRVLFICVHNSARSQMAEALLNYLTGDRFEAESAGLEPGIINPMAVEVMLEIGIDISRNATKSVFDILHSGKQYDWVITVCDAAENQQCPVFPGRAQQAHWVLPDPSRFQGSQAEKLAFTRGVREEIKEYIEALVKEIQAGGKQNGK